MGFSYILLLYIIVLLTCFTAPDFLIFPHKLLFCLNIASAVLLCTGGWLVSYWISLPSIKISCDYKMLLLLHRTYYSLTITIYFLKHLFSWGIHFFYFTVPSQYHFHTALGIIFFSDVPLLRKIMKAMLTVNFCMLGTSEA